MDDIGTIWIYYIWVHIHFFSIALVPVFVCHLLIMLWCSLLNHANNSFSFQDIYFILNIITAYQSKSTTECIVSNKMLYHNAQNIECIFSAIIWHYTKYVNTFYKILSESKGQAIVIFQMINKLTYCLHVNRMLSLLE